jgi:hypothetical protein
MSFSVKTNIFKIKTHNKYELTYFDNFSLGISLPCTAPTFVAFLLFFCQKVLLTIGELSLLEIKIHQNIEKNGERGEARTEPLVAVPNHVVSIIQMLLSPTLSNENNENPSKDIEDIEGNKQKKEDDTQNEKQNEKSISSSTFSSSGK